MAGVTDPGKHVTFAELAAWGERNNLPAMERRANDVGWAFLVNPLPLEMLDLPWEEQPMGWGPYVAVKSTRQVWQFGSGGGPIFCAATEEDFTEALREWSPGQAPMDVVPPLD
jgi:hypothetical protein